MLANTRTMLAPRRLSGTLRAGVRNASTSVSKSRASRSVLLASAALAGGALAYGAPATVHGDAPNLVGNIKDTLESIEEAAASKIKDTTDWLSASTDPTSGTLISLVWGSNKSNVIAPDTPDVDGVRLPSGAGWLKDVALRDLALQEKHAACVDARGDVYQWGAGYSTSTAEPKLTLRGKNITSLTATPTRLFALSSSGSIYVLSGSSDAEVPVEVKPASWSESLSGLFGGGNETLAPNCAKLEADTQLQRGEKFVEIKAGTHHLLARTSSGRTFAHPLSPLANTHGQLGLRTITIPTTSTATAPAAIPSAAAASTSANARTDLELVPATAQRGRNVEPPIRVRAPGEPPKAAVPDDIRWCDRLFEVPALRGINVAQVAAGARSSFARTADGRVLGWGANEFGQIGLGQNMTLDTITRPTEVVLSKHMSAGARATCVDIVSAGDLTFFTVERADGTAIPSIDVLACGNGQWGGLGNSVYTNAQGNPTRVRNVSGLLEYSESTGNLQPIRPYAISVSPAGHVVLTLDTLARAGSFETSANLPATTRPGRDLLLWGANNDGQLGNGKRSSLALPQGIPLAGAPKVEGGDGARFMLTARKAEVRDMSGKVWKKGVEVEQCAVAGYGCTAVYWKIR